MDVPLIQYARTADGLTIVFKARAEGTARA